MMYGKIIRTLICLSMALCFPNPAFSESTPSDPKATETPAQKEARELEESRRARLNDGGGYVKENKCSELLEKYIACMNGAGAKSNLINAQEKCSYENNLLSLRGCGGKDSALSPGVCTDALGDYETSKNDYKSACSGNADCSRNLAQCLSSAQGGNGNLIQLAARDVSPGSSQLGFTGNTCRDLGGEAITLEKLDEARDQAEEDRKAAREKYRDAEKSASEEMVKAQDAMGDLQKELLQMAAGLTKAEQAIKDIDKMYTKRKIKAKGDAAQAIKQHKATNMAMKQKIKDLKANIKGIVNLGKKKITAARNNSLTKKQSECTNKYNSGGGDTEYNRYVAEFLNRQRNPNSNLPIAGGLNEHLFKSRQGQGNFLDKVRKVYVERCIQESVNSYEVDSILADEDMMLTQSQLEMDGLNTQIENIKEQMDQLKLDVPQDLALMEEDAMADVDALKMDRQTAVKDYQNIQTQLQQMQMTIAQKQAQIPQIQQQAQNGLMQTAQELQMAELRYNQIAAALNNQDKAATIVMREKLKSIADKTDKGLEAYGKMDANETKAYRSCCFNGTPAAAVGGFVDPLFCRQGKTKEATRSAKGIR